MATIVLAAALPCIAQQSKRPPRDPRNIEEILDFHSDISLQPDCSLLVTETITVNATGNQIRHGIFRDFPTRYLDPYKNQYVVGFQMLSATRDSADEPFRIENLFNGKRIYLGTPNSSVPPGRHIYTFTYSTNRQLNFFKDHDEFFWNVTGNGWAFDIEHASATVHLPPAVPVDQVQLSGFTGFQGSRDAYLTTTTVDSAFEFASTRRLVQRQGLSILLSWPKGYFIEPTFSEKLTYFFRDNRDALLLAAGFLAILLYYVIAWYAVGRDPAPGVVMPLYEPPQTLSPAGMRYLLRMGFDNKTFAAAILDMAVRGFLTIKQQGGSYTLYRNGKDARVLTPDEKQIAAQLFNGRDQIWLHNENHQTISAALKALKTSLAAAEQKTYFVTNSHYLIAPVIFSIVIVVGYLLALGTPQVFLGAFISFWLTGWTLGVSGLVYTLAKAWRGIFQARGSALSEVAGIGKAIFITAFSIPFLIGELLGFALLWKMSSAALVVFLIAVAALHVFFFYLLKAPTFAGRRLMDQVEGFKLFLGAVDGDRPNRVAPPEQTPATFEKFLPYALALDVEQDWAENFSGVLAAAGTSTDNCSNGYTPSFYFGSSWNGNAFSGVGFASSISSSLTSAISSSSSAPGSGGGGAAGDPAEVAGEEVEEVGRRASNGSQRVAILCTRKGSPRGHITSFLVLQYGHMAVFFTSFPSPVDPTTRIARLQSPQRKIFCTTPPFAFLLSWVAGGPLVRNLVSSVNRSTPKIAV